MTDITVGDLKKVLSHVKDDAVISIGGDVISNITFVTGKIVDGYHNKQFVTGKGKSVAIVFKKYTELSDGTIDEVII